MTPLELTRKISSILDNKKAQSICAIEIKDITIIADYFLIATGTGSTQVRSLSDEVEFQLKQEEIYPLRTEGYHSSSWILLDYGSVVVHIFQKDTREFYDLERLWADGKRLTDEELGLDK